MSQDIGMAANPHWMPCGLGAWSAASFWFAGGLVVAGGVEGQFAEELAGGGVDDADVQVADEQQDAGSGVGPADADVVELPAVAQGDGAVGVDQVARGRGRGCRLSRSPGAALGLAWYAVAGVARWASDR